MTVNDKIVQVILDNLSIEDMQNLIKLKSKEPKKMTEKEYYSMVYTDKLKAKFYPPIIKNPAKQGVTNKKISK